MEGVLVVLFPPFLVDTFLLDFFLLVFVDVNLSDVGGVLVAEIYHPH